jgi:glucan phosphorylase
MVDYAAHIRLHQPHAAAGGIGRLWADPDEFSKKAIVNVASCGNFSSDRTIWGKQLDCAKTTS